jgi:hypothetical protein
MALDLAGCSPLDVASAVCGPEHKAQRRSLIVPAVRLSVFWAFQNPRQPDIFPPCSASPLSFNAGPELRPEDKKAIECFAENLGLLISTRWHGKTSEVKALAQQPLRKQSRQPKTNGVYHRLGAVKEIKESSALGRPSTRT